MKPLDAHVEDYLRLRRQLGFKLRDAGLMLRRFVRFAEQEGASFITTKLALAWATQPANISLSQSAARLGFVRRFAQYMSTIDPRTEVPPTGLLPVNFVGETRISTE
jgi:hypothetical protein